MFNPMDFYSADKITLNHLYSNILKKNLLICDNQRSLSNITQTIIYEDDFNYNIAQLYKLYETYYKFTTYLIKNHDSLTRSISKYNNILQVIGESSISLRQHNFPIIRQKHYTNIINIKYCKRSNKWYI